MWEEIWKDKCEGMEKGGWIRIQLSYYKTALNHFQHIDPVRHIYVVPLEVQRGKSSLKLKLRAVFYMQVIKVCS